MPFERSSIALGGICQAGQLGQQDVAVSHVARCQALTDQLMSCAHQADSSKYMQAYNAPYCEIFSAWPSRRAPTTKLPTMAVTHLMPGKGTFVIQMSHTTQKHKATGSGGSSQERLRALKTPPRTYCMHVASTFCHRTASPLRRAAACTPRLIHQTSSLCLSNPCRKQQTIRIAAAAHALPSLQPWNWVTSASVCNSRHRQQLPPKNWTPSHPTAPTCVATQLTDNCLKHKTPLCCARNTLQWGMFGFRSLGFGSPLPRVVSKGVVLYNQRQGSPGGENLVGARACPVVQCLWGIRMHIGVLCRQPLWTSFSLTTKQQQ